MGGHLDEAVAKTAAEAMLEGPDEAPALSAAAAQGALPTAARGFEHAASPSRAGSRRSVAAAAADSDRRFFERRHGLMLA